VRGLLRGRIFLWKGGGIVARLENVKWEAFCMNISKGENKVDAYQHAGYKTKNYNAAAASASKLLKNPKIIARIQELGDVKEKAGIADADEQKQFATAVVRGEMSDRDGKPVPMSVRLKALELLGKMQGLYVNHVETNLSVQPVVIRDDLGEADA